MRLLNDTDFANQIALPVEDQQKNLRGLLSSFAPFSLNYVRRLFPDIFNLEPGFLAGLGAAHIPFETIEAELFKRCRNEKEFENNRDVGALLHGFAIDEVQVSRDVSISGLRLARERKYWLKQHLVVGGRPVIAFVDPRGGGGLTPIGRKVVFSAMHVGLRSIDVGLEDARLLILQLPKDKRGNRRLIPHWSDDEALFSYDEIERMSSITEALWLGLMTEEEERRRRA